MNSHQKANIIASLMVLMSVFAGLKAAPPPGPQIGAVGQVVTQAAIDIVAATPTNERQPGPPTYVCPAGDACKPRVATWRSPPKLEYCNGLNWVDWVPEGCPDGGS